MDADTILSALKAAVPDANLTVSPATDRPTLVVPRDQLLAVCRVLRDASNLRFSCLTDMTSVDWWPKEPRFEVVYHLVSFEHGLRLRLKVPLPGDDPTVADASEIWPSAGWLEREIWDLMGIVFEGHRDLRRVMMPDDWEGHPLRKDHPVQIRMKPKVFEPLQVTTEEFKEKILADREGRASHGRASPAPESEPGSGGSSGGGDLPR